MIIAGVDEAGRGPLAGPVVAAAVCFKKGYFNPEINDSKQLKPEIREKLVDVIRRDALAWSVIAVGHHRITALNIRGATKLAMSLAVARIKADLVLIDGNMEIDTDLPQRTVVKGDTLHVEISAASILAKVWRDGLMRVLDGKYPGYGFSKHAGYPTESHRRAIMELGPCRVHRRTFGGVREFISGGSNGNPARCGGASPPGEIGQTVRGAR